MGSPPDSHSRQFLAATLIAALLPLHAVAAAEPAITPAPAAAAQPAQRADWLLGGQLEQWRLPTDESVGVARLALRRRIGSFLAVGVDSYAAVRGSRGGFITLGVGGEALIPLRGRTSLAAGLSLTAGGGRGGYQLSGGGLMAREQLGLRFTLPGAGALEIGASRVDFPNGGQIHSTQLYLGYSRSFSSRYAVDAADDGSGRWSGPALAASDRSSQQLSVFVQRLSGAGAQHGFGLVGAEWRSDLGSGAYGRLEAAGAASGGSSGYMQILGGLGYRHALLPRLAATVAASAGAGGGGGVDTGGGLLLEASIGVELRLTARDLVELSGTALKAPSASFSAHGLALRAEHRFGAEPDAAKAGGGEGALEPHHVRVRFADQQYYARTRDWTSRPNREFGNLGVQVDYFVNPAVYLSGQGLAAYAGRNGAYMIGLVGAGYHQRLGRRCYAELELLAGAAGGGGVEVGSGLVGQANAGLGCRGAAGFGVLASAGRLQARRGAFAANVLGLSVTYQTTLLTFAD